MSKALLMLNLLNRPWTELPGASLHADLPVDVIWLVAVVGAVAFVTLLLRGWREAAVPVLRGDDSASRLLRRLLIASIVLPFLTDEMIHLAAGLGFVDLAYESVFHIFAVSLLLIFIILGTASSVQQSERQRREALERARRSEERLRLQIDSMPIACITCTPEFEITEWNPAAERIFGWSADEIIGRLASAILPADVELDEVKNRLRSGLSVVSTNRNMTRDGREVLCSWSNTPLVDEQGNVLGVVAMAREITAEAAAHRAVEEAERRHRMLLDRLPHPVFSFDEEDRYTAANEATCAFFGRTENEIVGRTPSELGIPSNLTDEWIVQTAACRESGKTIVHERTIMRHGTLRHYRTILTPILADDGSVLGVTGIALDRTDQRAAEYSAYELLSAVEQLDEVIFTTDHEGVINYVNPAFTRVYGYSFGEAVGRTPRLIKSGEMSPAEVRELWSELLAGHRVLGEYRNRRRGGELVDVVASASPLFGEDGRVRGFVAVQRDVTAQKQAEDDRRRLDDRLAHLAKMESLGTLAGGLAHDFNNILSIVLSHTTLIERIDAGDPKVKRAVATVKQAVQRGASLSRQILTFARRTEIQRERVDLAHLILELGGMITETFPRTIDLTLDLDPDLPGIEGDAGQIHQALLNLCVNARDAMPDGGELTVVASSIPQSVERKTLDGAPLGEYVCIEILDTGTGMEGTTLSRIFDPFYTTKEKGKGTGLGLALVHGIVEAHGGRIQVESSPGKGSRFRLYFPGISITSGIETEGVAEAVDGHGEVLLVIDDESDLREALTRALGEQGFDVLSAADGPEGLRAARNGRRPAAVIMDLGMPKMGAVELIDGLRGSIPGVPIIAMTGYVDPEIHAKVRQAGVERILQKPFPIEGLFREVRRALDGPLQAVETGVSG